MLRTKLKGLNTGWQIIKPRTTALNIQIGALRLTLAVLRRVSAALGAHALRQKPAGDRAQA